VNLIEFQGWLDRYAEACRQNDARSARDLFAEDVEYVTKPFTEPWHGRDRVLTEWEDTPEEHAGFECTCDAIAFNEDTNAGAAHWWASYPNYETKEYDSAFLIWFDGSGRCRRFVEYYVGRADPAA
jgi:hypothetical protein